MSEVSKYEAQKKKMDGLCEEHDLVYRFRKDVYPITLTIRPIQGAGVQLSLLDKDEENYISPDAVMRWSFADGELTSRVEGGIFTISKTLRTKIENIFLKMIGYWQQYFFRDVIENESLRKGKMPVIDESDVDDDDAEAEAAARENEAEEDAEDNAAEAAGEEADDDQNEDGEDESIPDSDGDDPDEDLFTAATLLVRSENKASISLLQRRLNLGYSDASRMMDVLEERGVVGPYNGSTPREVLPYDAPDDAEV